MNVSIVTVAMNRTEHLKKCAESVSQLDHHQEHIILDFQSSPRININDLPNDKRIKLYYVDSPTSNWWLTHSYNLGFSLANSDYILKLDADNLINEEFYTNAIQAARLSGADLLCNRLTLQDWSLPSAHFSTNGIFVCRSSSLAKIRGFNPYIQGWGWDEIDLYSRFFLNGFSIARLPKGGLTTIDHDDALRDTNNPPSTKNSKQTSHAKRRLGAINEKNKLVALKSIDNKITWPSLSEYQASFLKKSQLIKLTPINIFSIKEIKAMQLDIVKIIYQPSRFQNLMWKIFQLFSIGPYGNSKNIFKQANIDVDLIIAKTYR